MEKKNQKIARFGRGGKSVIILAHATVRWAFCGAIIGIGRHLRCAPRFCPHRVLLFSQVWLHKPPVESDTVSRNLSWL